MSDKKILKKLNKPRDGKHLLKSKVFWVNLILICAVPLAPPEIKAYLVQPDVVVTLIGAVNVIMRLISSDKVYLK
jgi:hypothetical protein